MSACEKCWRLAGGDPEKYLQLLKERTCTPEESAGGEDAGRCARCGRMTAHMYTGECMACGAKPLFKRGGRSIE